MGDYENLVEMGFEPRRVTLALKKTKGFNDAITWLGDNEDIPIEELEVKEGDMSGEAATPAASEPPSEEDPFGEQGEGDGRSAVGPEAKSLKCSDCGKLFNTKPKAEFHASRTGHDNFEESTEEVKPMSEEEKAAHLEMLKKKLAEKRVTQAIIDQKAQRANEAIRRKNDAESDRIKEELRKREQLKEAEKRRREKQEDAIAKEKIRAQIKADQEARRLKAEAEKAAREGRPIEATAPTASASQPKSASSYTEARLQLRLPSGAPLVKSFSAETTLFEVASTIEEERGMRPSTFTTTFPKKTYNSSDFGMSLKEAKLVPSAVLIVA
ncbi:ubiquitin-related domain-containing protein [Tirmania nivea]|nr:ubiquitin-related domain-containing protein [Tirmania nivea]